jgi:hypothetical protein
MSTASGEPPPSAAAGQPSEEELRAAYEAELKRITTADVVLQTAVSLINLGGRRLGRVPGAEDERDLDQVRDAIDGVRGLMPVLERRVAAEIGPVRDALAQLQMAYAQAAQQAGQEDAPGGDPGAGAKPEGEATEDRDQGERPGPAQASGRLWVPGS